MHLTRLLRLAAIALAVAALSALGQPAMAGDTEKLAMRYAIQVDGAQVFKLRYKLSLSPGRYHAGVELDPSGFAGLFIKTRMDMTSSGAMNGQAVMPRTFEMVRKTKRKRRFNVSWNADGVATTRRSREVKGYKAKTLRKALAPNLPDPLAAMLRAGLAGSANPCRHTERVYNGEEVYELSFSLAGRDRFGNDNGGVYRGPAFKCHIAYRPIAGLSRKKHAKRSANPPVFTVWFAPVPTQSLGREILIPVAATGTLKGKTFTAFATTAAIAGRPFNAQSLASR